MKNNIFKNYNGNKINLNNKKKNIFVNHIKIIGIHPNKQDIKTFYNIPDNMLIYTGCYPIKYNEKTKKIECNKNSIQISIKVIGLTIDESFFMLENIDQKSRYIDAFREIKYYEYIRENIIKTFVCPNFVVMYTYFTCNNSDIDFSEINKIKKIGTSIEYINYYNSQLKNSNVILSGGNNNTISQLESRVNIHNIPNSKSQLSNNSKYNLNNSISMSESHLNIHDKINNALQSDSSLSDKSSSEKYKKINNALQSTSSLSNKSNSEKYKKINNVLQSDKFDYDKSNSNNLEDNKSKLNLSKSEFHKPNSEKTDFNKIGSKFTKNLQNSESESESESRSNSDSEFKSEFNDKSFTGMRKKRKYVNKKSYYKKRIYEYSGQNIYILTESPTCNFHGWTLQRKITKDNIVTLLESGYYPENVWQSIIFQLIVSLYVLFKHNIAFHDFSLEENVFIKKIDIYDNKIKCWKYIIDGIDFYIPNYGFILLIDTNFKDVTYTNLNIPTHKIYGSFFNDIGITNNHISEICMRGIRKILSSNMFINEFINGIKPPDNILLMLDNMQRDLMNKNSFKFDSFFLKHMGIFLNNRIGSFVNDTEKQNIKFGNISSQLTKGKIVTYQQNFNTYVFVMFLRFEHDILNTQFKKIRTNAVVLTRHSPIYKIMFNNKNTIDINFIETKVPITSLFEYNELIVQYVNPFDISLMENELYETYTI